MLPELKRFVIVCGQYGCGKTNLSVNLAMDWAKAGQAVTLVDLDIINPYFRSSDYTARMERQGIRVIAPAFAGSTLDLPSLLPEISSVFVGEKSVILDVGGDDAGATALGGFFGKIRSMDYDMLCVVNRFRALHGDPEEAAQTLRQIETMSRLKATGVVNNSHLKQETTAELIRDAARYGEQAAARMGLPLRFTTAPRELAPKLSIENLYPIDIYVKTPWE